jgi:hypothetical protein
MNRRGRGRRRRRAQRTYRLLVRLYPAAHRRAFGEDMVQTFGDHYGDAVECRGDSRLRFWLAVLADVGTSLLTEYAAEARTRHRQARTRVRRRRRPGRRTDQGRMGGARKRRVRVARRLRYRRRGDRPVRVVIRIRHHRLLYKGRIAALIALAALIGAALGTGAATGHLSIGVLLAGLSVTAWLAYSLRLIRPVSAGPHGDGPAPPGGASVREPRRPLPISPSGCSARPRPDQDEPGQAIALI